MSLYHIGNILLYQGKLNEALDYQKRAMSIYKKDYQSDHIYIAHTLHSIAYILGRQEKYEESLKVYQQALTI